MAPTEWPESIPFQTMPLRKKLSAETPRPVCKVYSLTGSRVLQTGTAWPKQEQVLVTRMELQPSTCSKEAMPGDFTFTLTKPHRASTTLPEEEEGVAQTAKELGQRLSDKQPGQAGPLAEQRNPPSLVPGRFFLPLISLQHTRPAPLPSMTPGLPTSPPKLIKCRVNFSPRKRPEECTG